MKEVYIKKYSAEQGIMFYLHFQDEEAVRQIEITSDGATYLTTASPIQGEAMLYDQDLDGLDLEENDFITKEAFEMAWQNKNNG